MKTKKWIIPLLVTVSFIIIPSHAGATAIKTGFETAEFSDWLIQGRPLNLSSTRFQYASSSMAPLSTPGLFRGHTILKGSDPDGLEGVLTLVDIFCVFGDDRFFDSARHAKGEGREEFLPFVGKGGNRTWGRVDRGEMPFGVAPFPESDSLGPGPLKGWSGFDDGGLGNRPFAHEPCVKIETFGETAPPAPVPEPATMLLLGAGLITLAGLRKKIRP
jgi:hypothetical protein